MRREILLVNRHICCFRQSVLRAPDCSTNEGDDCCNKSDRFASFGSYHLHPFLSHTCAFDDRDCSLGWNNEDERSSDRLEVGSKSRKNGYLPIVSNFDRPIFFFFRLT